MNVLLFEELLGASQRTLANLLFKNPSKCCEFHDFKKCKTEESRFGFEENAGVFFFLDLREGN